MREKRNETIPCQGRGCAKSGDCVHCIEFHRQGALGIETTRTIFLDDARCVSRNYNQYDKVGRKHCN